MKQCKNTWSTPCCFAIFEQRVEVRQQGMHAAIAAQAQQVQPVRARVLHAFMKIGLVKNDSSSIMRSMRVTSM